MVSHNLLYFCSLTLLTSAVFGAGEFIRPDFQNISDISGQGSNPGLIQMQGQIKSSASADTDGIHKLTEVSFGQPFSPFQFAGSSSSHARQIEAEVRAVLYPPTIPDRTSIDKPLTSGGAVFRYKWLLFSKDAGGDVTTQFAGIAAWFGQAERDAADVQIAKLRAALVVSPTDTGLRDLLLETYYDLAIAEMQVAKTKLAALSAQRLGVVASSKFVIDDEIAIYEELVDLESTVLAKYAELFAMEGVNPSDFDERELPPPGVNPPPAPTPLGFYIFKEQQPYRNAIASSFATDSGEEVIPDYDEVSEEAMPRLPVNLVLFSGYKDYVTLLRIMGQYTQHQADLARLRGMRQDTNDLTKARNAISDIQSKTATEFLLLRQLFGPVFLPGDASGVLGAINGVETALADVTNVRAFVNGTANLLGLDPSFLLLVKDPTPDPVTGARDSFDVLFSLLKGANQPLTDAIDKQADAVTKYQTFRASVDKVVAEVAAIDNSFQQRYFEITGYNVDDNPGFEGMAKPNSGKELDEVEKTIASVQERKGTLQKLTSEIGKNLKHAQDALTDVEGLDGKLETAEEKYKTTVKKAYEVIGKQTGLAAAGDIVFDGAAAIAGLDPLNVVSGTFAIGAAGAGNAAIQLLTSKIIAKREAEIDLAAVTLESALQKQDNALTVNQARQEVSANLREQNSIVLENTDNTLALAQAMARRTALLGEVQRIIAEREEDAALVKGSYYADPIQFIRSENALLLADGAFRNAQRWIFYTQRALEYKWQGNFARTESGGLNRSFDAGTVFKVRNAAELDDLLTQLKAWNDARSIEDQERTPTSFISLKDEVLTPNPNVLNLTAAKRVDPGVRLDLVTNEMVPQLELFQRILERSIAKDPLTGVPVTGNIEIDFDTSILETASFNVGPDYTGVNVNPGEWRDRIIYLKVNIIAEDGTSTPQERGGSLTYGGQTFYRTRIPPKADRTIVRPPGTPASITNDQLPGGFLTTPFRYYSSANYNNVFSSKGTRTQNLVASYLGTTAKGENGEETIGDTYKFSSFNQYSVAATGWHLTLVEPTGGWDVSKIQDIEFIVKHKSHDGLAP